MDRGVIEGKLPLLIKNVINFDKLLALAVEFKLIDQRIIHNWERLNYAQEERKERFFLHFADGGPGTIGKLTEPLLSSNNHDILDILSDGYIDTEGLAYSGRPFEPLSVEMNGECRRKIRSSLPLLVESVINFNQLLLCAIENGLINRTTVAHWEELDFCEDEKKERFFLQLTFGGSGTIEKFFDSLAKSNNRVVLAYLHDDEDDEANPQLDEAIFREMYFCDFEEISEVVVKPAKELYGGNSFDPQNFYRMESTPRGLALLLVNEVFDDPTKNRIGAAKDLHLMQQLLVALNFQVFSYKDQTRREIEEIVDEFIQKPQLHDVDSCVVAISSRGGVGGFRGTDGAVYAVETLRVKFNNVNCVALTGKPKLFLIQACRGILRVYDESLYDSQIADTIVEYSCRPGYLSNRIEIYGTWLFFFVVKVFMENAHRDEFAELITKVQSSVQAGRCYGKGLPKKFYFNPGL